MKILNGKVFENGKFVEKEVATDGSFFAADSGDGKEIDAAGCYVIPGLIDIHFHGCAGVDFCDGTATWQSMSCKMVSLPFTRQR